MFKKLSLLTAGLLLSVSVFASDLLEIFSEAENGDISMQRLLFISYYYGNEKIGITQNYPQAFKWLQAMNQQSDDAGMQALLGNMYLKGEGTRQDFGKALALLSKSANNGNSLAQYQLGNMYYNGQGVSQNYHLAVYWYEKSARQDDVGGQLLLGSMYVEGKGVSENAQIAKYWFGRACDNGEQIGCDLYKMLNEQGY